MSPNNQFWIAIPVDAAWDHRVIAPSATQPYTGLWTVSSDRRLKKDIEVITGALEKLSKLTGYTYSRINNEGDHKRYCGLIAQDVETVLPEAVYRDAGGYMTVAYGNTVSLLVEAIKELSVQVKTLRGMLMFR